MDVPEKINELDKINTQFIQFVTAVNGALIAYSFKQVENHTLTYKLIPLGLAIIFWGFSFYCGISSIKTFLTHRFSDIQIRLSESMNEKIMYQKAHKKTYDKYYFRYKNMFTYLYLGGISYGLWQILELIFKNISK